MKNTSPTDIDTGSELRASYSYHPAENGTTTTAIVHGVCHTEHCFDGLSDKLHDQNINTVLIRLQSKTIEKCRNLITIGEYTDGLRSALYRFEADSDVRIDSIAGHSMGGRLVQQLQNTDPTWRRPTIFMAPVPLHGTLLMLTRMALTHPRMLAKTLNGELLNAMRSSRELRILFGDAESTPRTINTIEAQLQHTSYAAYLSLLLPQGIQEEARHHPVMLMESKTDNLFPEGVNDALKHIYRNIKTCSLRGGHDFFIQHADETADAYARFHWNTIS